MILPLLFGCILPPASDKPADDSPSTSEPSATAEAVSDCKSSADAKDVSLDTGGYVATFSMTAEVDGDDVVLHMIDVDANCCPSPGAAISTSGTTITVDFADVTDDSACDCMCVFDFDVRIEDVPSGTWTLDVYDDGVSRGTVDVTMP